MNLFMRGAAAMQSASDSDRSLQSTGLLAGDKNIPTLDIYAHLDSATAKFSIQRSL